MINLRNSSPNVDLEIGFVLDKQGPTQGILAAQFKKISREKSHVFKPKTSLFFRFGGKGKSKHAFLIGVGAVSSVIPENFRQAGGSLANAMSMEKLKSGVVSLDQFQKQCVQVGTQFSLDSLESWVQAFCEGFALAQYQFKKYRKSPEKKSNDKHKQSDEFITLHLVAEKKELASRFKNLPERINTMAQCVRITRDWSNEPSNMGTPDYYASESQKIAQQYGLKCKVLGSSQIQKEKMGLFIGVGQGSVREGKIVCVEYLPKGYSKAKSKTVVLVGKGVTFDSGGISIKPAMRMEDMKHDMTGAATVFGATLLASSLGSKNRIVAIMGFTENMPSGSAIQPGNILTARNGKTVEILNTDAEGRLILADMLDYASEFNPDVIVDVATLTGAVGVALGKICVGMLGSDEGVMDSIRKSAEIFGEKVWQLPLFDEYLEDMKSSVADLRNSANDGHGGTIRGAIFLKQFVPEQVGWAHLDIASMAYDVSHLSYVPRKGASGLMVRTLSHFAMEFA